MKTAEIPADMKSHMQKMDFRWDERLILPEFIRIDQSGIGQFVGNLTQRFIGARADRETYHRAVYAI